ncbi:MAG: 2-C-methyl-D-erythritol 4-phosphate cytidylyltransferase [Porphyromonadaceae bacterium CG2_30_38_12]|nr:MAG: 2-C-methyl-D-erythritol 4-phosphate cytidylyltransferase [Porphyromonadaceae bacterium CG2_30_38_12]
MSKPNTVIIVAGGNGKRMQAEIPKQFILLGGKPILMLTIEKFTVFCEPKNIILVLPTLQIEQWKLLCKKHAYTIEHHIVAGGETRFESVKNGLKLIATPALVAIHDGVRPFVSEQTIQRCFEQAALHDTAVPVIDCYESIRELSATENKALNRSNYKLVQTPQVFDATLLLNAYEQAYSESFTDDASVVESYLNAGTNENKLQINCVEGNRENIKITTPYDMLIAEALIQNNDKINNTFQQ